MRAPTIDSRPYADWLAHPPLASRLVVDVDTPEAAQGEVSRLLAPHRVTAELGLLPFRAVHCHARLSSLSFNYLKYEPEVLIEWNGAGAFYLLMIPIEGYCVMQADAGRTEISPGLVSVINPFGDVRVHLTGSCGLIVVKIERTAIENVLSNIVGGPTDGTVLFDRTAIDAAHCGALLSMIDLACREFDNPEPDISTRLLEQPTERLLMTMMLGQLPHSHSDRLRQPLSRVAPWYVRRVEEFIHLHAHERITIADMTSVGGIGQRTLFQGFRDYRDTTPMSYLKNLRLERTRAALLAATDAESTVTAVARANGFHHLGNFTRSYVARFNERPSETLRFGDSESSA